MLLKVEDVIARLNISRGDVYRKIKSGEIPSIRLGDRQVRVCEDDLKEYINSKKYGGQKK